MKLKRGKRIKLLITILIILIILLAAVIVSFNKSPISGNVVLAPSIPTDCSNESIKALWDSVFIESSNNIQIYGNTTHSGRCDEIVAYKINTDNTIYLLFGGYSEISNNIISAIKFNATASTANNLRNLAFNEMPNLRELDILSNSTNRSMALNQPVPEIISIFEAEPSTWGEIISSTTTYYSNYSEVLSSTKNRSVFLYVNGNKSVSLMNIQESEIIPCTSNWIEHNTTCNSSETVFTYYTDANSCEIPTSQPENKTQNCDGNNDGIFGNSSEFTSRIASSMHEQITTYINGTSNFTTQNFLNKNLNVEIKGVNNTYLEFYWNFSNPLDLNNIYIEKQESGNRSYLLIKNLYVNKTAYLDILAESGKICVKNEELNSISAITNTCNKRYETLLECPESSGSISCKIEDNRYKIMGLTNSGVIEFIENETDCSENWNYSAWSECINNSQKRNATDLNYCGTIINKSVTTQPCGITLTPDPIVNSSCNSSWNCSSWSTCLNNAQNRTCQDKNNCKANKQESQACGNSITDLPRYIYIALIVVIAIAIAIVLLLLGIEFFSHGKKEHSFLPLLSFKNQIFTPR